MPLVVAYYGEYGWQGSNGSLSAHCLETKRALDNWDVLYETVSTTGIKGFSDAITWDTLEECSKYVLS